MSFNMTNIILFLMSFSFIVLCLTDLLGCMSLHIAANNVSNPACNYTLQVCGGLSIPYPFGMASECGLPEYRISCKRNASYGDGDLAFLQVGTSSTSELQVLEFSTNTIIVNSTQLKAMPSRDDCNVDNIYGYAAIELPKNGPFILSENNWFVVIGCHSNGSCIANLPDDPSPAISCTTSCYNQFDMAFCNYYACCINALPPGSWSLELRGRGIPYQEYPDVCGFSTVLSPSTYKLPPQQEGVFGAGHYGLLISWALKSTHNCSTARQGPDYACTDTAECNYDDTIQGYTCNCSQGFRGDGYKAGSGCKDIDECLEQLDDCEKPPLGKCLNTIGSYECSCVEGVGSGLPGTCPITKHNMVQPVLLGGAVGAALLAVILTFAYISVKAYRKRKEREENFRRVGGDQLEMFLFSEKELIKATKKFSDDHVIGEGGFGKVYWGKLTPKHGGKKVAIKRANPNGVNEQAAQMQSFVKELLLLQRTTHKNVVQLLGCCVETAVPLLVYEFVEKGTLLDYLKTPGRDNPLVIQGKISLWAWRLHIAMETAEALTYLHSMSEPIFHMDMKSNNILIDKHYNPKIADFGVSCYVSSDVTHITKPILAVTFGYIDPEYFQSLQVNDKCDVYSFGVILLELISGRPASLGRGETFLAHQFRTVINVKHELVQHVKNLPSFIDARLGVDLDVLTSINDVAELANHCIAIKGKNRPSMREVVDELKYIQSKYAGKFDFKGSIQASPYQNLDSKSTAAPFDYNWSPLNQFASTEPLFSSTQIPAKLPANYSTSPSKLQQCYLQTC